MQTALQHQTRTTVRRVDVPTRPPGRAVGPEDPRRAASSPAGGHDLALLPATPLASRAASGLLSEEERAFPDGVVAVGQEAATTEAPAPAEAGAPALEPAADPAAPPATAGEEAEEAAACQVTSTTPAHAPDGTPDTRTTVGTCEDVRLSAGGRPVDWTADSGWPRSGRGLASFLWAAPERAATPTVTATDPATGQACSLQFDVLAPASIAMRRQTVLGGYAAGAAGAGMTTLILIGPRSVSFGWLEVLEDPGPASGVTGYFAGLQTAGANLAHVPHPDFVRVRWNSTVCCDTAATVPGRLPPPYSAGRFDWRIPVRYRRAGSTGAGFRFTTVVQRFRMDAGGRVTVSKAGASVSRTP